MTKSNYHHYHFTDILQKYDEVCKWFNNLGFTYSKTRYGAYKKHFDAFLELSNGNKISEKLLPQTHSFDNTYIEVHEIIRVHNALKDLSESEFIKQIKDVLSGREFRGNSDKDYARDFLFELLVASQFIRAGYDVTLTSDCDIIVTYDSATTLFIECKRIISKKGLQKNIKKARQQLITRFTESNIQTDNFKGLIAVDLTDVLPHRLLNATNKETLTIAHHSMLKQLARENYRIFSGNIKKDILGVMCASSTMAYFTQNSIVNTLAYSRDFVNLPSKNEEDLKLLENITPKLNGYEII